MIKVNTYEAKTKLSQLLQKIEKENEVVMICRNGMPIAQLLPWKKAKDPLKQSAKLKKIVFREDPSLPLDESEWPSKSRE